MIGNIQMGSKGVAGAFGIGENLLLQAKKEETKWMKENRSTI